MKKLALALACSATLWGASPASAAAVFSFQEVGGDVVGTLSGSFDLTGLATPSSALTSGAGLGASAANFLTAPLLGISTSLYTGVTSPGAFGPGGFFAATSRSGDSFHFGAFFVAIDGAYVSGSALSGSMTFASATFATLGITPGSYVWTLPNQDTFTASFGVATAVPAPGGLPLLLGALGLFGIATRVSRRRA